MAGNTPRHRRGILAGLAQRPGGGHDGRDAPVPPVPARSV